jgi:hypothetical protein
VSSLQHRVEDLEARLELTELERDTLSFFLQEDEQTRRELLEEAIAERLYGSAAPAPCAPVRRCVSSTNAGLPAFFLSHRLRPCSFSVALSDRLDSHTDDLLYSLDFREFIARVRPHFKSLRHMEPALMDFASFFYGKQWCGRTPTRRTLTSIVALVHQVRLRRAVAALNADANAITLLTDEAKKSPCACAAVGRAAVLLLCR